MIFSLREGQAAQDDGPCALTNPNGVFGLNHCCNRCWRDGLGVFPSENPLVRVVRPVRS